MLAAVVCQAFEIVQAATFGVPASDEVLPTNLPGQTLGGVDGFGLEELHFQVGNSVQSNQDNRIVARFRGKCLAVEKCSLQNGIGKYDVFGE